MRGGFFGSLRFLIFPGSFQFLMKSFLDEVVFKHTASTRSIHPRHPEPPISTFIFPKFLLPIFWVPIVRQMLSNGQYYFESISTSTVFLISGTPLGLCASTYYVDISSSFFQRIVESQIIAFSVGIPIQKPDFWVGYFSNILLK